MESSTHWDFVPLEKKHRRKEFDCGNDKLNQYLRRYARQNDREQSEKVGLVYGDR